MLSRSDKQTLVKSKRKSKLFSVFLRLTHLFFKTYALLGSLYLTALTIVNVIYKSYLQLPPPFNDQLDILNHYELIDLLSIIITSIVFSGLIAILTKRRKRVRRRMEKAVEKEKTVPRKRRRHKAA